MFKVNFYRINRLQTKRDMSTFSTSGNLSKNNNKPKKERARTKKHKLADDDSHKERDLLSPSEIDNIEEYLDAHPDFNSDSPIISKHNFIHLISDLRNTSNKLESAKQLNSDLQGLHTLAEDVKPLVSSSAKRTIPVSNKPSRFNQQNQRERAKMNFQILHVLNTTKVL